MPISVRVCDPDEIAPLRECYRKEMHCQIIYDSIHARLGWTIEHALHFHGAVAGYGSVAVGGPWTTSHAVYEFYVKQDFRKHIFELFAELRVARRVVARLAKEKLKIPAQTWGGPGHGEVQWKVPTFGALMRLLHNPTYAGAYAYGQKEDEPSDR